LANIQDTAPEVEDSSVMFLGRYAAVDVFEYCGIFLESVLGQDNKYSEEVRDMIAPEAAILASRAIPGAMCYGAVAASEDRAIQIYAAKRVPQSWSDKDNALWRQRVSSRFCPVPGDSASWQTYSSVLASASPATGETANPHTAKANAKK
jgi:flagellar biosynthesis GTPase FlhF